MWRARCWQRLRLLSRWPLQPRLILLRHLRLPRLLPLRRLRLRHLRLLRLLPSLMLPSLLLLLPPPRLL